MPLVWASMAVIALEYAIDLSRHEWLRWTATGLAGAVAVATGLEIVARLVRGPRALVRERWGDLLVLLVGAAALAAGGPRVVGAIAAGRNLWRLGRDVVRRGLAARVAHRLVTRPAALLVATFASLIVLGTAALMARASTPDGEGASFLTALFTATSATCVTGLVVVDTSAAFSRFGQWVILVLIQLGGLGIMTITSALAVLLRVRLSARVRGAMLELLDEATVTGFRRLVVSATAVTLAFELAGALALYPALTHGPDGSELSTNDRLFFAAFHAVSAFCNAGFALYPDNLVRFSGDVPVNLTVMMLVLAGGIGFPVLIELLRPRTWLRRAGAAGGLSVHARLALTTSGLLVAVGAVAFLVFEWGGALGGLSPAERLLAALFQSVSFRTAGFNTVAFGHLHPATMLVGMALMFVGGSPLSTAGGVKTTTLAVLALALRALLRGRPDVEAHHRRLTAITIYRAVAVTLISGGLLLTGTVALAALERRDAWGELLFEAVSAFGTVGLSTGVTPTLGAVGKLVLIALMFVGRLGPFTMALTVSSTERGHFEYPTGKVLIG